MRMHQARQQLSLPCEIRHGFCASQTLDEFQRRGLFVTAIAALHAIHAAHAAVTDFFHDTPGAEDFARCGQWCDRGIEHVVAQAGQCAGAITIVGGAQGQHLSGDSRVGARLRQRRDPRRGRHVHHRIVQPAQLSEAFSVHHPFP
jgi:hypothetical protein